VEPGDGGGPDQEERYRRAVAHAVLRGVVHDLNQPLATVTMAAAALRSASDDAERATLLDIVEREAMRAGTLAAEASTRYSGPHGPSVPVTLGRFVATVRGHLGTDAEVVLDVPADGVVDVDADLLARSVAALVRDATTAPGRTAPVHVAVDVAEGDLVVTITDDGAPLADVVAGRPFSAHVTGVSEERGVGLAVAAARSVVTGHGGWVRAGRTADARTEVTVVIPGVAAPGAAAPPPGDTDAAEAPADATPTGTVLVVDDEETTRSLLTMVLERAGWDVVTAANGAQAEAAVQARPVRVVLLDLHVGADFGPDVAARLEAVQPGISRRLAYLTGDPPRSGGIDGCPVLGKPFSLDDLRAVIERLTADDGR